MTSEQPTEPDARTDTFLDPVEEILSAGIEEFGDDWDRVEEHLCARHTAHAAAIRWRVAALRDGGLLQLPGQGQCIPKRLGDFELVAEIGRGGMGAVYEARQMSLDRRVALKILTQGVTVQSSSLARFKREATTVARLRHPGIVQIHAEGAAEGIHYFAMELVEGLSLDKVVAAVRDNGVARMGVQQLVTLLGRPEDRTATRGHDDSGSGTTVLRGDYLEVVVRWIAEVADALDYAHHAGVVHRDVKPSNVLVRRSGTACLTDFGLAQEANQPGLTQSGQMIGSPYYMSPEQVRGRPVDPRTDVFSLGTTLYEIATLQVPFKAPTSREILDRILTREPRDPQKLNAQINDDLVKVIEKALEKDLARRYQTMGAFRDDLRAWLARRPVGARRISSIGRLWRWSRREPWKAGLVAALAISLPIIGTLWYDKRARQADVELAAVVQRQERSDELLVAGYLDLLDNRFSRAESTFQDVLKLTPDSVEAHAGLAVALVGEGESDAALRGLDSLPAGSGLQWARLYALRRAGRTEEADVIATSLPDPRSPTESWVAGFMLLQDSYWDRDLPRAAQALKLLSRGVQGVSAPKPIHLAVRANAAYVARDPEAARASDQALEPFLEQFPTLIRFQALARLRHDPRAAVPLFERALQLRPDSPAIHGNLGIALLRSGRFDAAIASFQEAIRQNEQIPRLGPKIAVMHYNLGNAYMRAGAHADALQAFEKCLSLRAEMPDALYNMGWVHERSGALDRAVETYRRCLDVDPDKLEARINLGSVLIRLRRIEDAVEACEAAVRQDPQSAKAQKNLAVAYGLAGDGNAEVEAWRHTFVLRPEDPIVHARFGVALDKVGDLHSAEYHHRRAVELAPDAAPPHHLLGNLLKQKNDLEGAVQCFRAALNADPNHVDSLHNLGSTLEALGKHGEAMEANERYAGLQPRNPIPHARLLRAHRSATDDAAVRRELARWVRAQPEDPIAWTESVRWLDEPSDRIEQSGRLLEVAQRVVDEFGDDVPEFRYVLAALQRQAGLGMQAIASLQAYLDAEATRHASAAFQHRATEELAAWKAAAGGGGHRDGVP